MFQIFYLGILGFNQMLENETFLVIFKLCATFSALYQDNRTKEFFCHNSENVRLAEKSIHFHLCVGFSLLAFFPYIPLSA